MDDEEIPVNLDYTKIDGIDPKKSYSYINNYFITCYSLLNKYSSFYEDKLAKLENDEMYLMSQINAIEAKLESVDGLTPDSEVAVKINLNAEVSDNKADIIAELPEISPSKQENTIEICKHPKFKKFFDMKKYGVPDPQIQLNMKSNGIDPNILDLNDPNKLISLDQTIVDQRDDDSDDFSSELSD